jgi:hypothetical protein
MRMSPLTVFMSSAGRERLHPGDRRSRSTGRVARRRPPW